MTDTPRAERNRPALAHAELRGYGPLADLLSSSRRGTASVAFEEPTTVRDLLGSSGIPPTEVEVVLVDGEPGDLDTRLHDGSRVAAYPAFHGLDVSELAFRPAPTRPPRFLLDVHLGRLTRWLRLLGFDCAYEHEAEDAYLTDRAASESRILLTRDTGLLKRRAIEHGYLVRDDDPAQQLLEVVRRYDLCAELAPFTRCLRCNTPTIEVAKRTVLDELQPLTREHFHEFRRCPGCGRIYWEGSHTEQLHATVERVRAECLGHAPT